MIVINYVMGIDGGGTSTVTYIADCEGNILGSGKSGPSNYQVVGAIAALSAIEESIIKAYRAANMNISKQSIKSACFGLAGIDTGRDYEYIFPLLRDIGYLEKILLMNDSYLALAGGNAAAKGLAIISGTGSIAVGINKEGKRKRVGGWGYIFDDRGSGYDIAVSALHAIFRAFDGRGRATEMSKLFCAFLEVENVEGIMQKVYIENMSRKDLAGLTKLVFDSAMNGDEIAIEIIRKAGADLAEQVLTVIYELQMNESRIVIPLVGGVLKSKNEYLLNAINEKLKLGINKNNIHYDKNKEYSSYLDSGISIEGENISQTAIDLIDPILQPSAGGLLLALDSIGININEKIINNLKKGE
ncbi:MAG: N-acetylglucosamine kinase [Halanaerobiales bacterium]